MPRLLRTQTYPDTRDIKEPTTKTWAEAIVRLLDDIVGKVAAIPFNRSEKLSIADTGEAHTEFAVTHHLGRIPQGYILTRSTQDAFVYDSGTPWTTTKIYLKCLMPNAELSLYVF